MDSQGNPAHATIRVDPLKDQRRNKIMRTPRNHPSPSISTCAFPLEEGMPCQPAPGRFSDKEMKAMGHVWELSQQIKQANLKFDGPEGLTSVKPKQRKLLAQLAQLKEKRGVWQNRRRQATHAKHAASQG